MVFFTCNACGQSIRKNRVEKHWQTECCNCEVLSCMDCGKDFYGNDYAGHTSCISEAEKYQGALFKGEKGGGTKGERKQQQWVQNITEMLSSRDVPPPIADLLGKILHYPNIPRKKLKFQNFLKNSINVKDAHVLDELWDIFTEASTQKQNNIQQGCDQVSSGVGVDTATETHPLPCKVKELSDIQEGEVEVDTAGGKSKKKKKKVKEEVGRETDRKRLREDIEDEECTNMKKRKKSKDDLNHKKSKKARKQIKS